MMARQRGPTPERVKRRRSRGKKLINQPDVLIGLADVGMVSAHSDHLGVENETGQVIVADNGSREGKVRIVAGGGLGHEPAFAVSVGRGLADAGPLRHVFASPSPSQIMDAGFAVDSGIGVLFLQGTYTGDVMNFDMAAERRADHGMIARSFVVTGDIASAPLFADNFTSPWIQCLQAESLRR